MSAGDVAVVRRVRDVLAGLSGLHNPDVDRVAQDCFAPDYEFVFARPAGTGLDSSYRGLQGFRDAMDAWMESWERWETVAEEFVDLGDRVLVLSRCRGRSPSGLEVDVETAELQVAVSCARRVNGGRRRGWLRAPWQGVFDLCPNNSAKRRTPPAGTHCAWDSAWRRTRETRGRRGRGEPGARAASA